MRLFNGFLHAMGCTQRAARGTNPGAAMVAAAIEYGLSAPADLRLYRLALLQGAMRRPAHFNSVVSDTPNTISTITGTKTLSISNTLA